MLFLNSISLDDYYQMPQSDGGYATAWDTVPASSKLTCSFKKGVMLSLIAIFFVYLAKHATPVIDFCIIMNLEGTLHVPSGLAFLVIHMEDRLSGNNMLSP